MNRNILATIMIVAAVGLYFTVTQGILAQAGLVKLSNDQLAAAIASADQLISERDQILASYKNLSQNDRDRLSKMVPNSVDNIRLAIDLNNLANQHGLVLGGFQAKLPEGSSKVPPPTVGSSASNSNSNQNTPVSDSLGFVTAPVMDKINVSFSVTAPYLQFLSFLQDLEANLRLMDITHLGMTVSDSGPDTFNVQLQTYWLRSQ